MNDILIIISCRTENTLCPLCFHGCMESLFPCKSKSIRTGMILFLSQFDFFMQLWSQFNLYCDSDLLQLDRIDYCDLDFPLTDKNIKVACLKRHI